MMKIIKSKWINYQKTPSYTISSDYTHWHHIYANDNMDNLIYSKSSVLVEFENGNKYLTNFDYPVPSALIGSGIKDFDENDLIPVIVIGN